MAQSVFLRKKFTFSSYYHISHQRGSVRANVLVKPLQTNQLQLRHLREIHTKLLFVTPSSNIAILPLVLPMYVLGLLRTTHRMVLIVGGTCARLALTHFRMLYSKNITLFVLLHAMLMPRSNEATIYTNSAIPSFPSLSTLSLR